MLTFRIVADGDAAILVELPQVVDPAANAWCVALADAVRRKGEPAVRDVVPGYCSVTVYFDPLMIKPEWLEQEIRTCAAAMTDVERQRGATVEIPVCYGGEHGPDLDAVARFAGSTGGDVVARHTAVTYRVFMIGFLPGFPYLGEVDARIAAPRRSTPRPAVPAGAVAIAGRQTGIYPQASPGGWNIIGRTPVRLFDGSRQEPCALAVGDSVRFRAITPEQFLDMTRDEDLH
jgi:inhibitor of KinA